MCHVEQRRGLSEKTQTLNMQTTINPWVTLNPYPGIERTETCDKHNRLERIKKSNDAAWLRQVLAWPDNQVTVSDAALRRLRRLAKSRAEVRHD